MDNSQSSLATALDVAPDIASTSHDYAKRFAGKTGKYFLKVQSDTITQLLFKENFCHKAGSQIKVLDLGGGHCQLTELFLELEYDVVMQGSDPRSFMRPRDLGFHNNPRVTFVESPLMKLNFPDNHFDLVSGIRLLAHVDDWQVLLTEMLRVSKCGIIFDFANLHTINFLTPLLFNLKKQVENNTRPYTCQTTREIKDFLSNLEIKSIRTQGQFVLPMALHRMLNMPYFSRRIEQILKLFCLTKFLGSPVLVLAIKN